MAAAAVDVGYIAASYTVPATTIETLLSSPTTELVQSLLVQIEAKAREFDDLKSDKLRADVELENTVRGNETRQKALKATADRALQEVEELRKKLSEEGELRFGPNCLCGELPADVKCCRGCPQPARQ